MKKNFFNIAIIAIVAIGSFLLGNKFLFVKAENTFSFRVETADEFYKTKHFWPIVTSIGFKAMAAKIEFNNLETKSRTRNLLIKNNICTDSFSKFILNPNISSEQRMYAWYKEKENVAFANGKSEGMTESFRILKEYYLCEPK